MKSLIRSLMSYNNKTELPEQLKEHCLATLFLWFEKHLKTAKKKNV